MKIEVLKEYSGYECKIKCEPRVGGVVVYYGVLHVQNKTTEDFGEVVVVEDNWTNSCIAIDADIITNVEVLKS